MSDPVTLSLMVASTAMSAAGKYQEGQAQSQALSYQSQVAANNQIIANQYADREVQKGNVEAQTSMLKTSQQEGAVRAAVAANGLDVNNGTPLRLQQDTARVGEMDKDTILNNAQQSAYGFRVQGLSYAGQSQLDTMASKNASAGGTLGAIGSMISGGSQVSQKWDSFLTPKTSASDLPGGGYVF